MWLSIFLFLHVMGAIAVFGPSFAFPVIASQAQKSPQNGPFAAAVSDLIERRIVIPGAIVQGITGLALVYIIGVDLQSSQWHWLSIGVVLYLIAILFAIFVQARNSEHMVELTKGMAAGPPPAAAAAGGAPAGPPPELVATAQKLQRGGMFLTALIVAIVFLMVVKPTIG